MKIISFCSEKGGVGKTTTTVNAGVHLALMGSKVLVVDLDGQANASKFFGFIPDGKPTTAELIYNTVGGMNINYDDYIRHSEYDKVDYIPASQMLAGITSVITNTQKDVNYVIKEIFEKDYFKQYDYILFDCRTLLDLLISNALNASDYAIIPVDGGLYSFDGLFNMLDKIMSVIDNSNPRLDLLGIILNKRTNTVVSNSVEAGVREEYKGEVFTTTIPYCPAQCENNIMGKMKETDSINIAFHNLAVEIAYRIKEREGIV